MAYNSLVSLAPLRQLACLPRFAISHKTKKHSLCSVFALGRVRARSAVQPNRTRLFARAAAGASGHEYCTRVHTEMSHPPGACPTTRCASSTPAATSFTPCTSATILSASHTYVSSASKRCDTAGVRCNSMVPAYGMVFLPHNPSSGDGRIPGCSFILSADMSTSMKPGLAAHEPPLRLICDRFSAWITGSEQCHVCKFRVSSYSVFNKRQSFLRRTSFFDWARGLAGSAAATHMPSCAR